MIWDRRTAAITGEDGKVVFEQRDIEVPKSWSMLATNVVASKYFRGALGTPEREGSVRGLIARVVNTIVSWGKTGGYFATPEDAVVFEAELSHLLLRQKAAFNSPVWFKPRREGNQRAPADERVFYQLRRRHHGVHPRPREDRGHALQVWLGHGGPTCPRCAAPKSSWRAVGRLLGQSASCAASTPLRA